MQMPLWLRMLLFWCAVLCDLQMCPPTCQLSSTCRQSCSGRSSTCELGGPSSEPEVQARQDPEGRCLLFPLLGYICGCQVCSMVSNFCSTISVVCSTAGPLTQILASSPRALLPQPSRHTLRAHSLSVWRSREERRRVKRAAGEQQESICLRDSPAWRQARL